MLGPNSIVDNGVRQYGRLAARPERVAPLDEFSPLTRWLRLFRLKEWVGFTLLHPEWASSMIMQDAHYLASSEIYVAHREDGTRYEHAVNARGGSLRLPAGFYGQRFAVNRRGYRIDYSIAGPAPDGQHTIDVDIAGTKTAPPISGSLTLHHRTASAPLSVSSRLPGGRMYTHKVLFGVGGTLRAGDREIDFDQARDVAILDEHRSMLPYRTRWLWGTFAQHTPDGFIGANFADRPEQPGQEEESGIWAPGDVEPLADITFTPLGEDDTATWRVASADGRLDAEFTPQGRKDVAHQLGIFAINYTQMFGTYDGVLHTADLRYTLEGVPGVCESMRARL